MKHLFPLTAIHLDGHTVVIDSIEEFTTFARGRDIGERHIVVAFTYNPLSRRYEHTPRTCDWIVRDDAGRTVLAATFNPVPSANWKKIRRNRRGDFEFRDGPVPGLRRAWKRPSAAARKRHGGRGVAARIEAFHSGPVHSEGD